jgi:CO/xanthine dehydrogenase Mo-binding subunit
VDDISFPGMLHGATVRSTIARGEILAIRHGLHRDGFTVVDFRDIPGRNVVALIENDQPCLAEREVRHTAEAILLLAHEDKEKLAVPRAHHSPCPPHRRGGPCVRPPLTDTPRRRDRQILSLR